jgi:hypothetical protein
VKKSKGKKLAARASLEQRDAEQYDKGTVDGWRAAELHYHIEAPVVVVPNVRAVLNASMGLETAPATDKKKSK